MADLGDLCRAALAQVRDGEEAEAYAVQSRRSEVKVRGGTVESLSSSETRGVGVRVVIDGGLGYAWAADPDDGEAADLIEKAREGARHATPDDANVLPEPRDAAPIAALYRDRQPDVAPARKVSLALDLERVATRARPDVRRVEDAVYG
ncbi:MAG TPA: DNA gyrase modulator, partial [Actinomycetota bacterium]|nr:DNA gyrase modulator [Actinomycetota bacterium]